MWDKLSHLQETNKQFESIIETTINFIYLYWDDTSSL